MVRWCQTCGTSRSATRCWWRSAAKLFPQRRNPRRCDTLGDCRLRSMARLPRAWREALALAEQHHLPLYDAMYLELSLRLGLALATFDPALQKAARSASVALL